MDAIEALDWGSYAFFTFRARAYPEIMPVMEAGYHLGTYLGVSVPVLLALAAFVFLGKRRAALVTLISFAVAVGVVQSIQFLVPRRRPEDAQSWLGKENMEGSYPSGGVLLFMLGVLLLSFAVWQLTPRVLLRLMYLTLVTTLTVWLCLSQLFLSIHFLTDILGAVAGAALISWVAYRLFEQPQPRRASVLAGGVPNPP
jgi:membrane-associated phospholipid phosphatase